MGKAARWVLGLDGGGSKTVLAYLSELGEVRGPALGAGINPFDQPEWEGHLRGLLRSCPPPGPLAHATLGLPGYGENAEVSARQEAALARLWPGRGVSLSPLNDARVAFEGAFGGGPGLLLLAGTGSMVWGSDGVRHLRVGGFGPGFGDEGSAHWIGVRALGLCSQVLDGRLTDRTFAEAVLRATGSWPPAPDTSGALLGWYAGQAHPRSAVAGLARAVDALAEEGNPTASDLLAEAAAELAVHLLTARAQLAGGAALPWSTAGGVLLSRSVLAGVTGWVGSPPQPPRFSPLAGALLHAARQADFAAELPPLTAALRRLAYPAGSLT